MTQALVAAIFSLAGLGPASPPVTDVEGSPAAPGLKREGRLPESAPLTAESPPPPVADKSPGELDSRQGSEATPAQAATLACVRHVESQGNYRAVSKSGKYRNGYQMTSAFWLAYGGNPELAGRHEQASKEKQDAVALRGYRAEGLGPWPPAQRRCAS